MEGVRGIAPAVRGPGAGLVARLAGATGLLLALALSNPPALPPYSLCGFHWLTGRPCPLCGLTRALFALADGRWAEAIRLNALSPLALAMLLALFSPQPVRTWLWRAGVPAFVVYGLLRAFLPG